MTHSRYAAGSSRSRGGGLVLAVLVHFLALMLILRMAPPQGPARSLSRPPMLTTFVTLPPPPPPPHPTADRPAPELGGGAPRRGAPPPPPPAPPTPTRTFTERPAPLAAEQSLPLTATVLPEAAVALGASDGSRGDGTAAGGEGTNTGSGDGAANGGALSLVRAAWIYRPTNEDARPFWPSRALAARRSGEVLLACDVPVPGEPRRCVSLREVPRGYGFGAAAVRLSRLFRIKPVTRSGAVAGGWIVTTVSFDFLTR